MVPGPNLSVRTTLDVYDIMTTEYPEGTLSKTLHRLLLRGELMLQNVF